MRRTEQKTPPDLDVIIVGGGIAGLASAWRLRHRRCVVLEADARPGGRIQSVLSDGLPLNLGAHMVPGDGTIVGQLVAETGLPTRALPSSLFGLAFAGRRYLGAYPSLLPFVLPLTISERVAFARLGATLRLGARKAAAAGRRHPEESVEDVRGRVLAFEDDRSLADLVGPLPERVRQLFRTLTERNGTDPEHMSAGHGLRSFANVWEKTAPGSNLVGGTAVLPEALAHGLGRVFRPGHHVTRVRVQPPDGAVSVSYETDEGEGVLRARACILATPAFVSSTIAPDLPERTRGALAAIRYGAFLAVGVRLAGTAPLPWRDTYAIATPGLGFSVLFNHDGMLSAEAADANAHSVMLFRGASGAESWIAGDRDALVAQWIEDLEMHFPETRGRIRDVVVMPWPSGAPYAFPGRAKLQPDLEACQPPVLLAGDYLEFPNMEAAASAGSRAAAQVDRWLDLEHATADARRQVAP